MAQIEITLPYVQYQCATVLLNVATQVALSRSKTKPAIKAAIQNATQIRLGLEALNYSDFLTRKTIEETLYLLSHIASVNAIPYAPVVTTVAAPTILVGVPGRQGDPGQTGATGGGTAFSASNVSVDTVVDSFAITSSGAAEWTYDIHNTSNKRVERLTGCWLPDGSQFVDDGGVTLDPEIGTTSGLISFSINISAGIVQLIAHVVSGTWTINGSRILIPVSGNGITQPTSLTNGAVWIGDVSNQPVSQILTGDVTVSNAGVTSIGSGVIVNADINSAAAIAVNKLAALTASKAVVSDSSGYLTTSATSATQIGYLSAVTSDVQAQINAIAMSGTITGAITTFVTSNASPSLAIVSNPAGKLAVSATTATQIGYLSSTTSNVQTQINAKVSKTGDSMTGALAMGANKITGLAAATVNGDALRFEQLINQYLLLTGGTLSGALTSSSTGEFDGGVRTQNSGAFLLIKIIQIGDWNMDTTATLAVTHGLASYKKIRRVSVMIRDDADSLYSPIEFISSGGVVSGTWSTSGSTILLSRSTVGQYDSPSYDSTGYNRGFVTIEYEN